MSYLQGLLSGAGAGAGGGPAPTTLTVRCGRCALESQPGGRFWVTADVRRGQLSLSKDAHGLVTVRWSLTASGSGTGAGSGSGSGSTEVERLVVAGTASWRKVKTGREGDRVYSLVLPDTAPQDRPMFWMQSMDASRDEDIFKKANDILGRASSTSAAPAPAIAGAGAAAVGSSSSAGGVGAPAAASSSAATSNGVNANPLGLDLTTLLASLSAQQPPRPTNTANPLLATPARPTGPSVTSPGGVTIEDLRRAMQGSTPATSSSGAAPVPPAAPVQRTADLQNILTGDQIARSGILNDPDVQRDLLQHLPEEQRSLEQLEATVRSPQFQQSLGSLNHALQNPENFHQIAAGFGLNPAAGNAQLARRDTTGAFLASVQAANPPEQSSTNPTTPAPPQPPQDNPDENKMEE